MSSNIESSVGIVADLAADKPIRVLHVDDEVSFLKMVKEYLEMDGRFRACMATSVEEALRKIQDQAFDVVISDYLMPGKDGLDFLKELRCSRNDIPFIVFTGKGREEVAIKALNLGADRYISKIGDPETVYGELAYSVRQAAIRRRAEQKLRESEEKYRNFFELAPDAIVTLDLRGFITSCNAATLNKTGYSRDEMVGRHFSKLGFLHSKDSPRYSKLFASISRGKVSGAFEVTWHNKDGTPFVSELHVGLIKKNGKTTGIQVIARGITERKKAEETLHESEERFRSVVENSHDGIFIIDDDFKIVYANGEAERIGGRPKEEIIGQDFRKFLEPDYKALVEDRYIRRQNGENVSSRYQFTITRCDGTKRDLEVKSTTLRNRQGRVQTLAQVLDITEQKKVENRLRKEKEKFETLFNLMADPVVIVDGKGKILAISDRVSQITGYDKNELIGKDFMKVPIVTTKSKAILMKNLTKRMMGKEVAPYRVDVVTKDGRRLPFEINAAKIEYEGKPADLVVSRNLEEREKAEKSIIENKEKFERLFIDNPEAAVYVDADFRILDVNPKFTELFGYSSVEIKGEKLLDLIVPEEKMVEAKTIDRKAKNGYIYQSDTVRKKKDGTLIPLAVSAAPVTVEGQLVGYVGLYKDISELKNTENAVRETMMKLAEMNEKLRVVGGLTRHDVRNKLTTIMGNAFLAKKQLSKPYEVSRYLEQVESAVQQVEEIFDFARSYEMLGIEKLTYLEVDRSIQEAFQLFSRLNDVKLTTHCNGLLVLADSLLRQLFYNLIDNSLRHGEKVSQIRIYLDENDKDQIRLIYEDDGVGVPKDKKEKIFMEGYGKGTGYGLYLIKKICEVYGWDVQETGIFGEGAQFTLTIPEIGETGKILYKLHQQ